MAVPRFSPIGTPSVLVELTNKCGTRGTQPMICSYTHDAMVSAISTTSHVGLPHSTLGIVVFAYLRGLMELRVKLAKTGSGELVPLREVGHGRIYSRAHHPPRSYADERGDQSGMLFFLHTISNDRADTPYTLAYISMPLLESC